MTIAVNGKNKKLAVNGAERTIPEGFLKRWPPVDDTDKEMVLASLECQ